MNMPKMIAFGPVPSRRLGHSLGINNIPPKICTYSCIYCQVGRTRNMQVERTEFYNPEEIVIEVENKIKKAIDRREPIDYLTFVPDGEPTLDCNLGKEIELLKRTGIKIAVISNASLIWREDVQNDLMKADWVSLKIDAWTYSKWRRITRPHRTLDLNKILQGMIDFSSLYKGELTTETMLIQDMNDTIEELEKIAHFIADLNLYKSYISVPTRPPAEQWARPAAESAINMAFQIFLKNTIDVEYLIGYEGNAFAFTGNVEEDFLNITSVHPMREDAVDAFLKKAGANWNIIENLLNKGKLIELNYRDKKFYMRKLPV